MLTIIESPLFSKIWADYWSVEEHEEFTVHIAANPEAGDLVPGSAVAARSGGLVLAWASVAASVSSIPYA